ATDACTNVATCDQTIWVLDTGGPVITNCPAPTLNLGCNPATIPDCDPSVGATSDCGTTVTCSKLDQTNGCAHTRTLTYTAVDNCNNTNTCTQVISWNDVPVLANCPAPTLHLGCTPPTTPARAAYNL